MSFYYYENSFELVVLLRTSCRLPEAPGPPLRSTVMRYSLSISIPRTLNPELITNQFQTTRSFMLRFYVTQHSEGRECQVWKAAPSKFKCQPRSDSNQKVRKWARSWATWRRLWGSRGAQGLSPGQLLLLSSRLFLFSEKSDIWIPTPISEF